MAWCNALSELEGLTPCDYTDAAPTGVLRRVKERQYITLFGQTPQVYINWAASGFRLPAPSEWHHALGGAAPPALAVTNVTAPLGSVSTSCYSCRDMFGTVWELTWDTGTNSFDPVVHTNRVALGGSFRGLGAPVAADNTYGKWPAEGHYAIGLRVVRGMGSPPPHGAAGAGTPA